MRLARLPLAVLAVAALIACGDVTAPEASRSDSGSVSVRRPDSGPLLNSAYYGSSASLVPDSVQRTPTLSDSSSTVLP